MQSLGRPKKFASSWDALICSRKTPRADLDLSSHCRKFYQRLSWSRRASGLQDTWMTPEDGKSPWTFWSAPEPFSQLKPAHLTLHRQQHWALHHTTKRIPSKMRYASGLLSIKGRKLQITLRAAGAGQSLLNASLGNTGILCRISHASGSKWLNIPWRPWNIVLWCCVNKTEK